MKKILFHRVTPVLLFLVAGALPAMAETGAPPKPVADDTEHVVYPWSYNRTSTSIAERFSPPAGYHRIAAPRGSFGHWLQHLPVKAGKPEVLLFDGRPKNRQDVHVAVIDMDVGERDLQQCADAAMRVWAEYLRSVHRDDLICFRTAQGSKAKWSKWRDGYRPSRRTPKTWQKTAAPSGSYPTFKKYLKKVFGVANSASILGQMARVDNQREVHHGDIYIEGATRRGYGHAVIVVDVAENSAGARVFLLAQSYMPAQEIHILKNPADPSSPWYQTTADGSLVTPEWRFGPGSLHRFGKNGC